MPDITSTPVVHSKVGSLATSAPGATGAVPPVWLMRGRVLSKPNACGIGSWDSLPTMSLSGVVAVPAVKNPSVPGHNRFAHAAAATPTPASRQSLTCTVSGARNHPPTPPAGPERLIVAPVGPVRSTTMGSVV
jgi:hypothetical protein